MLYLLTTTASEYFAARGFERGISRETLPASVQATAQFRELCPATAVAMLKPTGAMAKPTGTQARTPPRP